MLDLDVSLFFISLLIWVLMIILDKIYYKPVGKIIGQRENKTEKDSALIESMIADVENKTKNIEDVLKKARTDSMKLKENLIKKREEKIEGLILEEIISNPSTSISDGEVSPEYEEANKKMLKLQKSLEKLAGDYSDNLKSINKSSKKIEKAKKNNQSNIKNQKKTKSKISDQGKLVEDKAVEMVFGTYFNIVFIGRMRIIIQHLERIQPVPGKDGTVISKMLIIHKFHLSVIQKSPVGSFEPKGAQ